MENCHLEITFRDFFKASELFEDDYKAYNGAWLDALKNVDWQNLHKLSTDKVREDVIGFLNKWKCRLARAQKKYNKN